jgi:hypothetical protein
MIKRLAEDRPGFTRDFFARENIGVIPNQSLIFEFSCSIRRSTRSLKTQKYISLRLQVRALLLKSKTFNLLSSSKVGPQTMRERVFPKYERG